MELYHLDWEKAADLGGGRVMDYIMPLGKVDDFAEKVREAFEGGDLYKKVASFEGVEIDQIYNLSQNIDSAWIDNMVPGMTVEAEGPQRSTSVGDVIRDGDKFFAYAMTSLVPFTLETATPKP